MPFPDDSFEIGVVTQGAIAFQKLEIRSGCRSAGDPNAADRLNEAFLHQVPGQAVKVEIAAKLAKAVDEAVKRCSRCHLGEGAQHARCADVSRRKDLEASEATQQHKPGAPRSYTRQVEKDSERIFGGHAFNMRFVQFTRLDQPAEMTQRFGFTHAQAAPSQRRHTSICDGSGRRKRMKAAPVVLQGFTEAFDQISNDGYTRFQTQLLKRHDVGKCLEETGKPRRPHAAQRVCRGTKCRFSRGQPEKRLGIYVQSEHPVQGVADA